MARAGAVFPAFVTLVVVALTASSTLLPLPGPPGPDALSLRGLPGAVLPRSSTPELQIMTTSQLGFTPANPSVGALTITLEVSNPTSTQHTFTLSSDVNVTVPTSTSTSNTTGSHFAWPNLLVDQVLNASQTVTVTVTFPTWGTYQFVCRFHFSSGMEGAIDVTPPAQQSSSTSMSSGGTLALPLVLLTVGGAAVVVVAIVVIFARRRRRQAA